MIPLVLGIPRTAAPPLPTAGAWPWQPLTDPEVLAWRPRATAEADEGFLQLIPYAVIERGTGELWSYQRLGGDPRLKDRRSCGVGGHIDPVDQAKGLLATAARALRRELREELGFDPGPNLPPPCAWLYEGESAVGRVHLGLIYRLLWTRPEPPRPLAGEALAGLGFQPAAAIAADSRYELWSRLAAGFLHRNPQP